MRVTHLVFALIPLVKISSGLRAQRPFFGKHANDNMEKAIGYFKTDELWLKEFKPDVIIAFFGFNSAFLGSNASKHYQLELEAFVDAIKKDHGNAELVLVTPTAYEDISDILDVPNGEKENKKLKLISQVMVEVAKKKKIHCVDVFGVSQAWYSKSEEPLTSDGAQLNSQGYQKLAQFLNDEIFGAVAKGKDKKHADVLSYVKDKNWFWQNYFKIPNGVHVYGRRHNPHGPKNYPFELNKLKQMVENRDVAIWNTLAGKPTNLEDLDAKTDTLPVVETNYNPVSKSHGELKYLKGEEALSKIKVAPGYKIEQWANEDMFPDLANPVQMTFDNKGRLWVATMPSYPHYRPGDAKPNDKLIILEDTNGDGKADKQITWADQLHLAMGFEIIEDGVLVSQGYQLLLLKDLDGDDQCDHREVLYSGFDDHDTHHAISAFETDPSGAVYMSEGIFLRSNIETPYGPVRGTDGGFFRYNHKRRHLERHAQLHIPNPWGLCFDRYGQNFYLQTSSTKVEWMLPGTVKSRYGVYNAQSRDLIETENVRPTSGLEIISSRHFPDEVQGDMIFNNVIGFLGTKQHALVEDGTGYKTKFRQNLIESDDDNFRPVDLEFAPDGSLYLIDWHNVLIGHAQHNARDPHRDHVHGRVYRVTLPITTFGETYENCRREYRNSSRKLKTT